MQGIPRSVGITEDIRRYKEVQINKRRALTSPPFPNKFNSIKTIYSINLIIDAQTVISH